MAELKKENKQDAINQDIINLVVARLQTIPRNISISVGGGDSFTVDELIEGVKEENDIGKTVIKMQLDYLRSLKDLAVE